MFVWLGFLGLGLQMHASPFLRRVCSTAQQLNLSQLLCDFRFIVITHFGTHGCCGCLIYSQTHAVLSLLAFLFSFSAFWSVSCALALPFSLCLCLQLNIVKLWLLRMIHNLRSNVNRMDINAR